MSLLVRKIEKAKWLQNDIIGGEDISADAITNCMKTTGNTLSTWQIQNRDQAPEAVLAIVAGHQYLDTIDIVCVDRSLLEKEGIFLQQTRGKTPVKDLIESHIDISNLSYKSLGTVANLIVHEIQQEKVTRFTKGMIKKLLNDAINKGKLKKDDLHESVQSKL